jgi:hypothetical protein
MGVHGMRNACSVLAWKLGETDPEGNVILKWTQKKYEVKEWARLRLVLYAWENKMLSTYY